MYFLNPLRLMVDSQNQPPLPHQKHNPHKKPTHTTPWHYAARRPPVASIFKVCPIAICHAIVLDHPSMAIYILVWKTNIILYFIEYSYVVMPMTSTPVDIGLESNTFDV
jgi:hypothetical protein